MNNENWKETEIKNDAIGNLKSITGIEITDKKSKSPIYDYDIKIENIDFAAEVKGGIEKANLNLVVNKFFKIKELTNKPLLLIAQSISTNLFSVFQSEGINVLESSGNCQIKVPGLIINIKGEKKTKDQEVKTSAFSDAGIKLIYYFLTEPEGINKTYREIREETGLSLGTISNVIEDLKQSGFVVVIKNKRRIKNRRELLDVWQTHYNRDLKPKLFIKEMDFADEKARNEWNGLKLPEGMIWGGEGGAYLTNQYMTPVEFDIYTEIPSMKLLSTGKFKYKEKGSVKLYKKFWKPKMEGDIAKKVLLYADLMGSGNGRNREAAEKLIENGI